MSEFLKEGNVPAPEREGYNAAYRAMLESKYIGTWERERLHKLPAWARTIMSNVFLDMENQHARLIEVETRLSDSVKDTERMNWLQLHREDLGITRDLRGETVYVDCSVTGILAYGPTLREAVDAAIAQEAAPPLHDAPKEGAK